MKTLQYRIKVIKTWKSQFRNEVGFSSDSNNINLSES